MNLKLREYRERFELTQKQFAREIKKAVGTIQAWEAGDSYPNAEAICLMCEFFRTDPNDFLGWYDEHPGDRPAAPATREESALLDNYRASPPDGRATITAVAQMACGQGEEDVGSSCEGDGTEGVSA